MNGLRMAVVFLTRMPIGLGRSGVPDTSRAVPWFPVVGALLGAAGGLLFAGLLELMAPLPAAALVVASLVLATGAFHLDGLGDVADAFAGGSSVERRLEIMRDSRLGTYGVAAVTLALMLQVSGLAALGAAQGFAGLVTAHALGRSAAIWMMASTEPARREGLGVDYLDGLGSRAMVFGSSSGPVVCALAIGWWGIVPVVLAIVVVVVLRRWSVRAIGGISGDVLGAVEQVVEAGSLICCAALASRVAGWPWWT